MIRVPDVYVARALSPAQPGLAPVALEESPGCWQPTVFCEFRFWEQRHLPRTDVTLHRLTLLSFSLYTQDERRVNRIGP
jgi:hypothetical protein